MSAPWRVELNLGKRSWEVLVVGGNVGHAFGFVREEDARETAEHLRLVLAGAMEAAEAENRRLREALDVIATCPAEAVHLMPLAAQAALAGEVSRGDG